MLSDRNILELQGEMELIYPFYYDQLQPCSYDLRLGCDLKTIRGKTINLNDGDYTLKPNEFILGSTFEHVSIPNNISAFVDGKSSLGRLGIAVHITAGFIDSGFNGNITLEIKNNSDKQFKLSKNMLIGQIIFFELKDECMRPYGDKRLNNHYQNSKGTILSKYMTNDKNLKL